MLQARRALGAGLVWCAALAACQAPAPERTGRTDGRQLAAEPPVLGPRDMAPLSAALEHRIAWGDGEDALGFRQRGFERVAQGPRAVALAPDGAALILDQLGGRIVQLTVGGLTRRLATVPADAEDLAASEDGSLVAFSPVRSTAWVYGPDGAPAGEVRVPRIFREIVGVALGPSRTVQAANGYQELIDLGSPSAPLPLAVAMRTKKEGAVLLGDGRGIAGQIVDGRAELVVVRQGDAEQNSEVVARHQIDHPATAVRVVGVDGTVVCARLEEVSSSPEITVARRAVCLRADSAEVTLDRELPPVGSYLPRRELAVGGGYLAFIHPEDDGLTVHRWRVATSDVAGAQVQP